MTARNSRKIGMLILYLDLIFLGRLEHGAYEDCLDVHVDLLNRCYGVHGKPIERQTHQTGAGHPADEEETLGTEEGKEWHGIHGETDTDNEELAGIVDNHDLDDEDDEDNDSSDEDENSVNSEDKEDKNGVNSEDENSGNDENDEDEWLGIQWYFGGSTVG
ncbi:hypothetical protein LENED_001728 [Lentinula edodes]|uniref:Uncharacterized protein n=1 Tax=Lentinula edodes TaxID=5353 RepID=A0A1Q3DZ93_LENED|nr:hypothetical protein LENED_001728 [Lentinula edodes]